MPQDGDWYVLAADETSIPAAGQVLAALPKPPHTVFVEVAGPVDERPLPAVDASSVTWFHRGDDPSKAGSRLEEAFRAFELPEGRGYFWIACESGAMRRIRAHLLERGVTADRMVTRGYWKLGASNHPDGDYGQDMTARG